MEVGVYLMLRERYAEGRTVISCCKEEYHAGGFIAGSYCKVTRQALVGMCLALGVPPPPPPPPPSSLTLQFLSGITTFVSIKSFICYYINLYHHQFFFVLIVHI